MPELKPTSEKIGQRRKTLRPVAGHADYRERDRDREGNLSVFSNQLFIASFKHRADLQDTDLDPRESCLAKTNACTETIRWKPHWWRSV